MEKVLCPYCGAEMTRSEYYDCACYECNQCHSESPSVFYSDYDTLGDMWQEAKALAIRRCQPENRVLTQEELLALSKQDDEIVWFEFDFEVPSNGYREPHYVFVK